MSPESTEEIRNLEQQGIEFVERNCFEETCWMDERRIDRGDRSGSEEEKSPRDD